jgi:hypothetical protein
MRITKLQLVRTKGYDNQEWEKIYHNNQKEYIRKKLRFIADCVDLNSNFNRARLSLKYKLDKRFNTWTDAFLSGGLVKLCQPITRQIANRISEEQKLELKNIITTQTPKYWYR